MLGRLNTKHFEQASWKTIQPNWNPPRRKVKVYVKKVLSTSSPLYWWEFRLKVTFQLMFFFFFNRQLELDSHNVIMYAMTSRVPFVLSFWAQWRLSFLVQHSSTQKVSASRKSSDKSKGTGRTTLASRCHLSDRQSKDNDCHQSEEISKLTPNYPLKWFDVVSLQKFLLSTKTRVKQKETFSSFVFCGWLLD